ncbi:MAG: hypothetical protein H6738_14605 [Alphaproteobacteria bacterium]|nr:hypothetical protein [Alphaproteobacteria bacterium]MCB9698006.1 hypothetical protein [Alphaproteobacteria bacterium]
MTRTSMVFLAVAVSAGCESGTAEVLDIDVAPDASAAFDATAPGLLRASSLPPSRAAAILCGQPFDDVLQIVIDHGFGCLADGQKGSTESRAAWVEPMPAGWDASALCALPDPRYDGVDLPLEAAGTDDPEVLEAALATEPDPSWFQGTGSGAWKRDASPCGGTLRIDLRVE